MCGASEEEGGLGMASEDMDSLTFGAPYLLRHLTKSQSGAKKDQSGVIEVNLKEVLEDMKLTQEEVWDVTDRNQP